jgi:hypothetical protein
LKLKKCIFILFFCIPSYLSSAQVPGYELRLNQIFDNREYFSEYAFPQTIFGVRLDASLHFEVDTIHSFYSGFNYLYEHGSSIAAIPPNVILYYTYIGSKLNMSFGSFPRINKIDLPLVFLNDTLNYYRPNVEGAYLSYSWNSGSLNAFIDWTGRVSEQKRETFLIGVKPKIKFGNFFAETSFLMYHNARSYSNLDTIKLQDNGILSLLAGYQMEEDQNPFKAEVSGGVLASYNRFRPADFSWGRGMLLNINLRYNIFGLKGVYYIGTPIDFTYGDPFYQSGNYGRADFYVDPFGNPRVKSKIAWNLHFVPGEGIHNSQQILISVLF